jgi:hypothetical protein
LDNKARKIAKILRTRFMLPSREDFLLFRFDEIENETLEVET